MRSRRGTRNRGEREQRAPARSRAGQGAVDGCVSVGLGQVNAEMGVVGIGGQGDLAGGGGDDQVPPALPAAGFHPGPEGAMSIAPGCLAPRRVTPFHVQAAMTVSAA